MYLVIIWFRHRLLGCGLKRMILRSGALRLWSPCCSEFRGGCPFSPGTSCRLSFRQRLTDLRSLVFWLPGRLRIINIKLKPVHRGRDGIYISGLSHRVFSGGRAWCLCLSSTGWPLVMRWSLWTQRLESASVLRPWNLQNIAGPSPSGSASGPTSCCWISSAASAAPGPVWR